MDDNSWQYKFGDKSLEADTLKDLEVLVSLYGLKWNVLDENLAGKALKIDENNRTGFLNVYVKNDMWYYRGSDLKSRSLQGLKKKVLSIGLEWRETDSVLADKNWKLDLRKFKK